MVFGFLFYPDNLPNLYIRKAAILTMTSVKRLRERLFIRVLYGENK